MAAAAAATIIITATAAMTIVSVGVPTPGGVGAAVGEGETEAVVGGGDVSGGVVGGKDGEGFGSLFDMATYLLRLPKPPGVSRCGNKHESLG